LQVKSRSIYDRLQPVNLTNSPYLLVVTLPDKGKGGIMVI
jgi:hypothetical protein